MFEYTDVTAVTLSARVSEYAAVMRGCVSLKELVLLAF